MKINQPIDNPIALSNHAGIAAVKTSAFANPTAKPIAQKTAPSAGVAVSVSPLARALDASAAAEAPVVDTAKVQEVRSAIAQGTYVVNPEAIADKLLSNAQEMLKRSRA